MRSIFGVTTALAFTLTCAAPVLAAPKSKAVASPDGTKKSGKEISTDDKALDKQMDWEAKVLGPNNVKKIDHAKIQKLQAEELARREKQEKIDQAERDRKEREAAAAAAAQRNVKAPSTREVPEITETVPVPAKPVEKHDDAFVDKLLTGKAEKKKVSVSNDEVDQLLTKAKHEKPSVAGGKGSRGKSDGVDQLLASADKQPTIQTTAPKPAEAVETVSAEAAAREATLKAIAAAAAKAQEEKARRKPVVPDAAVLRAQAAAASAPAPKASASRAGWTDPFAADGPSGSVSSTKGRGKVTATNRPSAAPRPPAGAAGRHAPTTRPAANDSWQDPFDSGARAKPRPTPAKTTPARPGKHPPNWKDPFA